MNKNRNYLVRLRQRIQTMYTLHCIKQSWARVPAMLSRLCTFFKQGRVSRTFSRNFSRIEGLASSPITHNFRALPSSLVFCPAGFHVFLCVWGGGSGWRVCDETMRNTPHPLTHTELTISKWVSCAPVVANTALIIWEVNKIHSFSAGTLVGAVV